MAGDILVVDDEADIRELVAAILEDDGYAVRTAHNAEAALAAIKARKPALVLLDIWMQGGGMDGLELLDLVKELDPDLPVIMISGHGNIETAVSAIKRGAYDFLEKPFKSDRLMLLVDRALEAANLRRENRRLRTQAIVPDGLVGASAAAQQLRQMIAKVASANSRVLISGPPGSGKETAARMIHAASPRARSEFVAVSAAGMTPERMDLELFGQEGESGRPAKIGVFERAHGGTLYIDDVADMPKESQSRILRVLVEQRFRRVGGDTDVQVDVRVVSSTSRDLRERDRRGTLPRGPLPPAQRGAGAGAGLGRAARGYRRTGRLLHRQPRRGLRLAAAQPGRGRHRHPAGAPLAGQCTSAAQQHRTPADPGLRRSVRAHHGRNAAAGSRRLGLGRAIGPERMIALPLREAREVFEREYLNAQMVRFSGNISRTAAFIGMERSALHRKLKSLGVALGAGSGRRLSRLMSRIAYVNGRFVPHREACVHIEDRGYQFADGVYEVWAVFGGRLADSEGHADRLQRSLHELRMDRADEPRGLAQGRAARDHPAQSGARWHRLPAGEPRRSPARPRLPDPPDTPPSRGRHRQADRSPRWRPRRPPPRESR